MEEEEDSLDEYTDSLEDSDETDSFEDKTRAGGSQRTIGCSKTATIHENYEGERNISIAMIRSSALQCEVKNKRSFEVNLENMLRTLNFDPNKHLHRDELVITKWQGDCGLKATQESNYAKNSENTKSLRAKTAWEDYPQIR